MTEATIYINYCCEVFEKLFLRSLFSFKFRFCFVKLVKVDFSKYRCFPVLIFCFHLLLLNFCLADVRADLGSFI